MSDQNSNADRTLTVERVFDAPPARVWNAWTDPRQLEQWFGPRGWTTTVYELNLQPGGIMRYCMHSADGEESCGVTTYQEIEPTDRLTYLDAFSDSAGNINQDMPQMLIEVRFIPQDGKTRLVSTTNFDSAETLQSLKDMGMLEGLNETWDRLAEFVSA
jgi:uncharacterized protein YndB with AHSA1/START domain